MSTAPRITVSMPFYKKPQRTRRAIKCILDQSIDNWEAFIMGDGCPYYSKHFALLNDPRIEHFNGDTNMGEWGTGYTNYAISVASGKYFVFMGSDDEIDPDHFAHYLLEIEDTDLDFVWFDDYTLGKYHKTKLRYASVGHSNIIVRTEFLKSMPMHESVADQDWRLIEDMMQTGKYKKSTSKRATYHIMTNVYNRVDPEGLD